MDKITPTERKVLAMIAEGEQGGRLTGPLKTALSSLKERRLVRTHWIDDNTSKLVLTAKGLKALANRPRKGNHQGRTMNKISKLTQDLQATTKEAAGGKSAEAAVKEAAGSGSVHSHIMMALGDVAEKMGKFLGSKYKEGFTGFSTKAYDAGYMSMGVSSEIKNKVEPNRKGDIGVEVKWDPRQGEYPTARVWAVFPKAKQYSREIAFKLGESPDSAVKRIGPAFVKDLDNWMTAVAKAYGA